MTTTNDVIEIPDDLTELCRVCLQIPDENNCLDITMIYDEDDNLTYGECFTICTNINLSDGDNLPHNLCKTCGLELQMSYDFYKKVEESKRSLEQYQQKIEEVTKLVELKTESAERRADVPVTNNANTDASDDKKHATKFPNMEVESLFQSYDKLELEVVSKDRQQIDSNFFVENEHENEDHHQSYGAEVTANTETAVHGLSATAIQEEHLDEFNIVEALEDEETQHSKLSNGNSGSIILHMDDSGKYFFETGDISNHEQQQYTTVTIGDGEFEESSQDSQQLEDDTNRSWQENVVAVANKEHIPLEMVNQELHHPTKDSNEDFAYELIENDEDAGANDVGEEYVDMVENDKEGGYTNSASQQSRKRHFGSFSCDFCQKVYPNYSRMITHRRCHEKDRPKYTCEYCGRIYATKQAMDCHVQTFHKKTGFTCHICQKIFAIRRSLEVHMRFHTGDFPYACNLCDKKFAQLGHLNTHKNVRHNNVRFGCNYPECGKFFTSSSSLRNHEFSHSAMPFECHYCQRGYPAKAKLKVHVKRKHNIELSIEQLEDMRKFHVARSKVNLVKVVPIEDEEEEEEI